MAITKLEEVFAWGSKGIVFAKEAPQETAPREVTAKFRVIRVTERENGKQVDLFPDLSGGHNFLCGTPTSAGQISITVTHKLAKEVFTQGRWFLVTFTPEDKEAPIE